MACSSDTSDADIRAHQPLNQHAAPTAVDKVVMKYSCGTSAVDHRAHEPGNRQSVHISVADAIMQNSSDTYQACDNHSTPTAVAEAIMTYSPSTSESDFSASQQAAQSQPTHTAVLKARPPVPRHRPSPPPLPPPLSRLGNPASSGARTTSVRPSHSSISVHRSASPSTPMQKSPRAEVPVSLGHAVRTPQPPSQRPASCPPRSKMRDRPCTPSAPATKRPSR